MANEMSQAEFARRHDVSPPTINRLVRDGKIPRLGKGVDADAGDAFMQSRGPQRNPSLVKEQDRDFSVANAQQKKIAAQAALAMLEYRKRSGQLIDRAGAEAAAEMACNVLRSKLAARNSRLGLALTGKTAQEIKIELDKADYELLAAFSKAVANATEPQ